MHATEQHCKSGKAPLHESTTAASNAIPCFATGDDHNIALWWKLNTNQVQRRWCVPGRHAQLVNLRTRKLLSESDLNLQRAKKQVCIAGAQEQAAPVDL